MMEQPEITKRLKAAEPTMVEGPSSGGDSLIVTAVCRTFKRISGADEPRAIRDKLAIVSFQTLYSKRTYSPFSSSKTLYDLVYEVMTSIDSMKMSEMMATPTNIHISQTRYTKPIMPWFNKAVPGIRKILKVRFYNLRSFTSELGPVLFDEAVGVLGIAVLCPLGIGVFVFTILCKYGLDFGHGGLGLGEHFLFVLDCVGNFAVGFKRELDGGVEFSLGAVRGGGGSLGKPKIVKAPFFYNLLVITVSILVI